MPCVYLEVVTTIPPRLPLGASRTYFYLPMVPLDPPTSPPSILVSDPRRIPFASSRILLGSFSLGWRGGGGEELYEE